MADLTGEESIFSGHQQPTLAMIRFTIPMSGISLESSDFLLVQMREGVV